MIDVDESWKRYMSEEAGTQTRLLRDIAHNTDILKTMAILSAVVWGIGVVAFLLALVSA